MEYNPRPAVPFSNVLAGLILLLIPGLTASRGGLYALRSPDLIFFLLLGLCMIIGANRLVPLILILFCALPFIRELSPMPSPLFSRMLYSFTPILSAMILVIIFTFVGSIMEKGPKPLRTPVWFIPGALFLAVGLFSDMRFITSYLPYMLRNHGMNLYIICINLALPLLGIALIIYCFRYRPDPDARAALSAGITTPRTFGTASSSGGQFSARNAPHRQAAVKQAGRRGTQKNRPSGKQTAAHTTGNDLFSDRESVIYNGFETAPDVHSLGKRNGQDLWDRRK